MQAGRLHRRVQYTRRDGKESPCFFLSISWQADFPRGKLVAAVGPLNPASPFRISDMTLGRFALAMSALVAIALGLGGLADSAEPLKTAKRPAFDLTKRVPFTTSHVHGAPGPPDPYQTEVAFPQVKFDDPLEICVLPGASRLIVAERKGKIFSFENDRAKGKPQLLIDVKRTVYGVVAHPDFAKNGYIYASSIVDATDGAPKGTRVSRFICKERNPPQADMSTEKIILEWPSGGHNGGCLRFGPDRFLYISTGDGSGIADMNLSGQNPKDLLGSILRIDVNRVEESAGYSAPTDNPFADGKEGRPEVYAYGIRQTWKFSWDSKTGLMWGGDVGQDLWEEVNLIVKGGNYGWSIKEGDAPFRPNRPKGLSEIIAPVIVQPHSEFRSLTGGYFYHGSRLPDLQGLYVYGDYDTGKIWAMKYDDPKSPRTWQLADTQLRIIAFCEDPNQEIYILDFIGGQVHRLAKAPPPPADAPKFPTRLSQTGLFSSTKDHTPAAGLIPYSVNAPLWSDGAEKERFLALPGTSQIEFDVETYPQPAPGAPPGWRFPADTVLVKTFSLELEKGNSASKRRLETRLLHFKPMPGTDEVGAQFWRGYTYIWNEDQSDAELAEADGLTRTYSILDASAKGGKRDQVYRFPSRSECTMCHTFSAKYSLGVETRQMNKDHDYGGKVENQLAVLERLGVFKKPLPKKPAELPKLVDYHDKKQSLEDRARSYLHSNCAHCHRKWGGGNAEFQLLQTLPVGELGIVDTKPGQGAFGLADPRILVPGDPARSLIAHRMGLIGSGRMPHISSNKVDEESLQLIKDWIKQLPKEK